MQIGMIPFCLAAESHRNQFSDRIINPPQKKKDSRRYFQENCKINLITALEILSKSFFNCRAVVVKGVLGKVDEKAKG